MAGQPVDADAVFELRHQLLVTTDRALGAEAELARVAVDADALRARLVRADRELGKVAKERDKLAGQLSAVRASLTWRIGHAIVHPVSRLGRRAGLRR